MFAATEKITRTIGKQEFKVATDLLSQNEERIENARRNRKLEIEQR
jgi:hypothetical protein